MFKCPTCKKSKFSVFIGIDGLSLDDTKKLTPNTLDYKKAYIASIECENCDYVLSDESKINDIFGCSCSICGAKSDVNENGICESCMNIYKKINSISSKEEETIKQKEKTKTSNVKTTAGRRSTKATKTTKTSSSSSDPYADYFDDEFED